MKDGIAMSRTALYLLMAAHVLLAAGTYVFGKAAAVGFPDAGSLTLARSLGAALILLVISGWLLPKPSFSRGEWLKLVGFGILLVPMNQYAFLQGLRHTVPSHPALFYALTPLGVLLLSSAVKLNLPSARTCSGVIMALAGVLCILRPWTQGEFVRQLRTGDLWVICAVLAWVVYTVAASRTCQNHDPRVVTSWSLIFGALAMIPISGRTLLTMDYNSISSEAWLGLLWLVIMTSVLMMLAWNLLLRHLTPVQVAVCTNAQPPTTVALSVFLAALGFLPGKQDLGLFFWLGMLLTLIGVFLVQASSPTVPATPR